MAATIPTVTHEDLLAFHSKHFHKPFQGTLPSYDTNVTQEQEEYYEEEEDDGLGYYPDGTKRTLTDEQIEIFRHSEIQRLLSKQRREAEAAAAEKADNLDSDEGEIEDGDGDEEAEYKKFLEKERKQFKIDAEKKRAVERIKQEQEVSRAISTRRRVRELDEMVKQEDIVLDY